MCDNVKDNVELFTISFKQVYIVRVGEQIRR